MMERLLYWVLFVAGLVLAAWLPAKSAFADADPQPALNADDAALGRVMAAARTCLALLRYAGTVALAVAISAPAVAWAAPRWVSTRRAIC